MADMYCRGDAERACRELGLAPDALHEVQGVHPTLWEPNWVYMLRELNERSQQMYDDAFGPKKEQNYGSP